MLATAQMSVNFTFTCQLHAGMCHIGVWLVFANFTWKLAGD